jgi:hypothetical protein
MNRNVMYHLLKDSGMKDLTHWADDRRSYHTEFRLTDGQSDCTVLFNFGYVRHVYSIHLCSSEIVIESKWSDMKVNVNYRDIEKLEVRIEEDE